MTLTSRTSPKNSKVGSNGEYRRRLDSANAEKEKLQQEEFELYRGFIKNNKAVKSNGAEETKGATKAGCTSRQAQSTA